MKGLLLLALIGGCGQSDPTAQALEVWEQGRVAVEAEDWAAALTHFEAALQSDPDSPALLGWKAHVQARSGDVAGATITLDAALQHAPRDAVLHYNRAAYLSRLEQFGDAHQSLLVAFSLAPELRGRAADDRDFVALSDRVPQLFRSTELMGTAMGEAGSVLIGEPYELSLTAEVPAGESLEVAYAGEAVPPFRLERVIETVRKRGDKDEVAIRWSLVPLKTGEGDLGPWTLRAGSQGAMALSVPFQVVAAGTARAVGEPLPASMLAPQPSRLLGAAKGHGVSTALVEGWVVVAHPDGMDVQALAGLRPDSVRLESRVSERIIRVGTAWRWLDDAVQARVRLDGQTEVSVQRID